MRTSPQTPCDRLSADGSAPASYAAQFGRCKETLAQPDGGRRPVPGSHAADSLKPEYPAGIAAEEQLQRLLVQPQVAVECWRKAPDDAWTSETITDLDASLELRSIGLAVPCREIYREVFA